MLKITPSVVASAIFEFYVGSIQNNFDVAESPVLRVIRTRIAQNVVRRSVFLYLRKYSTEIVRIEKRFAAGVRGERRKRFLRGSVTVQVIQHGRAGIRRLPMQAGVLCFASTME